MVGPASFPSPTGPQLQRGGVRNPPFWGPKPSLRPYESRQVPHDGGQGSETTITP
jgi:hypothetical protein